MQIVTSKRTEQLWTEQETADWFRISLRTLQRLRKAGEYPGNHAVKLGRSYFYPPGPDLVALRPRPRD